MKIPMPPKLLTPAILIFSLLSAYYLYQTANALSSGSLAAHKRYHQAEIISAEDPFLFYQTLAFQLIGCLAPAWAAFSLYRQKRSKTD